LKDGLVGDDVADTPVRFAVAVVPGSLRAAAVIPLPVLGADVRALADEGISGFRVEVLAAGLTGANGFLKVVSGGVAVA
jgi:hypothetical protein